MIEWFEIKDPAEKVKRVTDALHEGLLLNERAEVPMVGRSAEVVALCDLPPKPGLSTREGKARLIHDLANIELQAMELGARTLFEFPDAPKEFREQLADLALNESEHLMLCIRELNDLGYEWGHWPVHLALWNVTSPEDTLLDRILIVHRYLEGSGLDAGDSLLRRLTGVPEKSTRAVVQTIATEEIGHVLFGSRWYHSLTKELKIDAEKDFAERLARIAVLAPRRERIATHLRRKAGFTEFEIAELQKYSLNTHGRDDSKLLVRA